MTTPEATNAATLPEMDYFTQEIIRSYLVATVADMVETTRRTAYSTVISEALDFTCGLLDADGRLVAQGAGLPVHAGTLVGATELIRDSYDSFSPGDVIVHNDPYRGGGHQADVVVARPLFHDDVLIGFAVNRGHWLDIGGMVAGGWSGTAQHVVQEALLIPPVKLYKAGVLDREIKDFILTNVRLPRQDWGDLNAQMASCTIAQRRVEELIERYGLDMVRAAEAFALEYSRRRFLAGLGRIPNGTWSAEEFFEDDAYADQRHRIRVKVTKSPEKLVMDFTGTDSQVAAPINNSFVNTKAACYIAAVAVVDSGIPLNSGFMDSVEVIAPPGTLVHAVWPAPCFLGPADPTNKGFEVVMRALSQGVPERAVSGSYQTGNNTTGSGVDPRTGEAFQWFLFGAGGCGARFGLDGNLAEWHPVANCKNESVEVWERRSPVQFQEFSLIQDSGGPGRTRGGLGYRRRFKVLAPTAVSATADRHRQGAWGIADGREGRPNRFAVRRDDREYSFVELFNLVSPSKFANVPLRAGDEYIVESGGGGGFGDPLLRDPDLVRRDVEYGFISPEVAYDVYGIVLASNGALDTKATEQRRKELAAARLPLPATGDS